MAEDKLVINLLFGGEFSSINDVYYYMNANLKKNFLEKNQKFMFMVYKNINEFLAPNETIATTTTTTTTAIKSADRWLLSNRMLMSGSIVSNVVSIKVNDISVIDNLKQTPIEITLKHHLKKSGTRNLNLSEQQDNQKMSFKPPVCVYWNYDKL